VTKNSRNLNILLADDDKSTTVAVSVVLKQVGHRVNVVHDGEEALLAITHEPAGYQLVITDHQMKFTGLELVTQLKKIAFPGKILVLSGYLETNVKNAYRRLGVKTFIFKPFDLADLRKAVEELAAFEE